MLIASVYIGFAVADGRRRVFAVESSVASVFVVVAAAAVTGSPWLLVVGLVGHGLKDLWQHRTHYVANTRWWPPFCLVVDFDSRGDNRGRDNRRRGVEDRQLTNAPNSPRPRWLAAPDEAAAASVGSGRFDVAVIGAGQAGLAVGYFLARQGRRFVILDAADAVGAAWRDRWDSLVLFTPRRYDALPGLAFPGDPDGYPTRDEVIAYLEQYAATFDLPIEFNSAVRSLSPRARSVPDRGRRPANRRRSGGRGHRPVSAADPAFSRRATRT